MPEKWRFFTLMVLYNDKFQFELFFNSLCFFPLFFNILELFCLLPSNANCLCFIVCCLTSIVCSVVFILGWTTEEHFLVKYKGLAHVHNRWVTKSQLLLEAPPSLLEKFNQGDQVLNFIVLILLFLLDKSVK